MATSLVGREDEVALLRGLIADLPNTSAAVMVRGEAGIGKTLLVQSVLDELPEGRVRILRGCCAPMSTAIAYGGLNVALGSALAPDQTNPQSSAAAGRALAMARLLDVLDDGPPGGTILLVEDAHWADWSTLDFLSHTTRNLPERLLALVSWRDEDSSPEVLSWLGEQLRNPAVTDLPLRRLTLQETSQQLRHLHPEVTTTTVEEVYRRSAGNPYLTVELAAADPSVSSSLRQILLARLQVLSRSARTVVAATGTLARPLSDEDLLAAARGEADAVREACESALVIREPDVGTMARHPVLAEVAYEQLLSMERHQLHARLAEHLEACLQPGASASTIAEVAEQYHRAGLPDATLTWSVEAAHAAEAQFALAEAGHWYAIASAVRGSSESSRPEIPKALVLAEKAAAYLGGAGHPARALALLDQCLAEHDREEGAAEALLARSWLRVHIGDTEAALADVDHALRVMAPDDDVTRAKALCARAMALATCSRPDEAAAPARAAWDLADRLGDRRTTCRARLILATVSAMHGRLDDSPRHLDAALSIAREIAQPEEIALAGVGLTDLYWRLGEPDHAVAVAEEVRPDLRRLTLGRHWLEDLIEGNVITSLFEAGRWDEALAWAPGPTEPSGLGMIEAPLAEVHIARGERRAAADLLERSRRLERGDQPMFNVQYAEVLTALHLLEGRPQDALEAALTAADAIRATEDDPVCATLLLSGLEAAVAVGATDEFEQLVALLGSPGAGKAAAATRCVIDGERSRLIGAPDPEAWLRAAHEWQSIGRPYPEAMARLRAAEALLGTRGLTGARVRAARELRSARRTAEDLGAAPLLDQILALAKVARIQLDDATTQRPERTAPTSGASALTARERQVLALLADGRTNREIGDALYMSPKTASVHVTHILEKLGVQTRVQAAASAVRHGLDGYPTSTPQGR